jgi:hypothetical protein
VAIAIDKHQHRLICASHGKAQARVLFTFVNRPLLFGGPAPMLVDGNSASAIVTKKNLGQ